MMNLKGAHLRACVLAAAMLAAAPASAYVVAGDTFRVSLTGQWQGGSQALFNLETTLGSTQTFVGAGHEGQDITVSSSVTTVGGNTLLDFSVTTPVNFMLTPAADFPAAVVGYVFNLGGTGGQIDRVDFDSVPTVLGASGGWNGDTQGAVAGGLVGSSFAGSFSFTTGSYSVPATYTTINSARYRLLVAGAADVPEPATLGLFGLGALGLGLSRRRKA